MSRLATCRRDGRTLRSRPGTFGMIALEDLRTGSRGGVRAATRARDFAAQPGGREDLARVAQARRVEGAPHQLHLVKIIYAEHLRHIPGFIDSDAVLAGDRPAV